MTKPTHDSLDKEEARHLTVLRQAARYSPISYAKVREVVARRFAEIDQQRKGLIKEAQK